MNQMFKKASSVLTAVVCAASITFSGASLVLADGEIDDQTKTTIETTAEGLTETIIPLTDEQIEAYMESGDDFTENAMTAWNGAKEELGDMKETGSVEKSGTHEKRADEISGVSVTVCQGFIFAVKII